MIWGLLGKLVEPVTKLIGKRTERKQAKESAKAKLDMARVTGEQKLEMTDAEWEALAVTTQNDSWKDEYITIIITLWIPLIFLGAIVASFNGIEVDGKLVPDTRILDGVNLALDKMKEMKIDMGELTKIVVLAAVGLKLWRNK